jgi:hypothetical protein
MSNHSPHVLSTVELLHLTQYKREIRKLASQYRNKEIAHSNVEIAVRHFIHPSNYHLGKEAQRIAAVEMNEWTDKDGMWPACQGELWWQAVMLTPQCRPPELHPLELLVHSATTLSLTDCARYIAGIKHLPEKENYDKLMISRNDLIPVTCPECLIMRGVLP